MKILLSILFVSYITLCVCLRDRLYDAIHMADVNLVKKLLTEVGILTSNLDINPNRVEKVHGRISLFQCGLDPQYSDLLALDENCFSIAKLLNNSGANMSHVDKHGWNAVAMGAVKGFTKFTSYIIDCGANINNLDENGRTPLMKAVTHGHLKMV